MSYVWNIENIEETLIQVFNLIVEKDINIGILEHYCNIFFRNPKEEHQKKKADDFIRQYVIENNQNYKKNGNHCRLNKTFQKRII
jgi:hypothetical protein